MHESYKKWLEDDKPKVFCICGCDGEIVIKHRLHKYYGIPKYINNHHEPWNKDTHIIHESYQKWLESDKPKIFCQCGCNKEIIIKKRHEYCGIPKYIHGHNRRGEYQSIETKKKLHDVNINENNPNFGKIGKDSPNWRGGISFEPYCEKFNNVLKEEIRKRDNYQCQNPDCLITQLESKILYGKALIPHHIHYDKENCYPDLITLCHSHNVKANFNRDYWEQLYMKVLENRNLLNYFGDINEK